MKFSCGRCGKRYATAEAPVPGRIYKIKCRACGDVIVVKASAAGAPSAGTEMRAPTSLGLPAAGGATARAKPPRAAPVGDVEIDLGAPATSDRPAPSRVPGNAPQLRSGAPADVATAASGGRAVAGKPHPTPPDPGYVDLFADTPTGGERPAPRPEGPEPAVGHAPTTTPSIPFIPKPPQQRSVAPMVLVVVAGVVVLGGILAFVLLGKTPAQPQLHGHAPAKLTPAQPTAAGSQAQQPGATVQAQPPAAAPQAQAAEAIPQPSALAPAAQPAAPPPSRVAPAQPLPRQGSEKIPAAREKRDAKDRERAAR